MTKTVTGHRSQVTRRGLSTAILVCIAGCSEAPTIVTITFKRAILKVEYVPADPRRRFAPVQHARLTEEEGILAAWPYDRRLHYFSTGSDGGYDVFLLAADGRILERTRLAADDAKGIASRVEARYAFFLREGWGARHNVGDDDRVELPPEVTGRPPDPMPEIRIGGVPLRVEVNVTLAEQSRGYMHRRASTTDEGMLFYYTKEAEHSYWMGFCYMGLDIAYFDGQGAFINVVSMDPYPNPERDTEPKAPSARKAQWVVEAPKGWFRAKGLVDEQGRPTRELRIEVPESIHAYARKL